MFILKHSVKTAVKKTTTFSLLLLLTMPTWLWAFNDHTYLSTTNNYQVITLNGQTIMVPNNLGTVEHTFQGKGPIIIHVQDLHCHAEVQMNIAKLVKHLAQTTNLNVVGQEGAFDRINLDLIASFPLRSIARSVGHYYIRHGMMTGAEYCAGLSNLDLYLTGIDSPQLYQQSQKILSTFMHHESLGLCYDLKQSLLDLKSHVYHPALKKWDQTSQLYQQQQITLDDYARQLLEQAKKLSLASNQFPLIQQLAQATTEHPDIYGDQLEHAFQALEHLIRINLYQNNTQKQLDHYLAAITIMERLLNISATYQELQQVEKNRQDYSSKAIMAFLQQHQAASNLDQHYLELDHYLSQALHFYRLTDQRSGFFASRLQSVMAEHRVDRALIITGGFHTAALLDHLRQKNISYLSIKPLLTQHDMPNPYFSLLSKRASAFEQALSHLHSSLALPTMWPDGDRPAQPAKLEAELRLESSAIHRFFLQGYSWPTIINKMKQLLKNWSGNTRDGIALGRRLMQANSSPTDGEDSSRITLPTTIEKDDKVLTVNVATDNKRPDDPDMTFSAQPAETRSTDTTTYRASGFWSQRFKQLSRFLQRLINWMRPLTTHHVSPATLFTTLIPPMPSRPSNLPTLSIAPGMMCPWMPLSPIHVTDRQITFSGSNINNNFERPIALACQPYSVSADEDLLPALKTSDNQAAQFILRKFKSQRNKNYYIIQESNPFGIAALGHQQAYAVDEALAHLPLAWFYSMAYRLASSKQLTLNYIMSHLPPSHQDQLQTHLAKEPNPSRQLWLAIDFLADAAYPQAHQELIYQLQGSLPRTVLEEIATRYQLQDRNSFIRAYLNASSHLALAAEIQHAEALADLQAVQERLTDQTGQTGLQIRNLLTQAQSQLTQELPHRELLKLMVTFRQHLNKLGNQSWNALISELARSVLQQLDQPLRQQSSPYQRFLMHYCFSHRHPQLSSTLIITLCHQLLNELNGPDYPNHSNVLDNLSYFFDETNLSFSGKTWEALQLLLHDSLIYNVALIIPAEEVQKIPGFRRYFNQYPTQQRKYYFKPNFQAEMTNMDTISQQQLLDLHDKYDFKRNVTLKIYEKLLETSVAHEVVTSLVPYLESLPPHATNRIATLALLLKQWSADSAVLDTISLFTLALPSYQAPNGRPTRFALEANFKECYSRLLSQKKSEPISLAFYQQLQALTPQDPVRLELLSLVAAVKQPAYTAKQVRTVMALLLESYQIANRTDQQHLLLEAITSYIGNVTSAREQLDDASVHEALLSSVQQLPQTAHQPRATILLQIAASPSLSHQSGLLKDLVPLLISVFHAFTWANPLKNDVFQRLQQLRKYVGSQPSVARLIDQIINRGTTAAIKKEQTGRLNTPIWSTLLAGLVSLNYLPSLVTAAQFEQLLTLTALGLTAAAGYWLWRHASQLYQLLDRVVLIALKRGSPVYAWLNRLAGTTDGLSQPEALTISLSSGLHLPSPPPGFDRLTNYRTFLPRYGQYLLLLFQTGVVYAYARLTGYQILNQDSDPLYDPALKRTIARHHFLLSTPSLARTDNDPLSNNMLKVVFLPSDVTFFHFLRLLMAKELKQEDKKLLTVYYPSIIIKWYYFSRQVSDHYPTINLLIDQLMLVHHQLFLYQQTADRQNQATNQYLPSGFYRLQQLITAGWQQLSPSIPSATAATVIFDISLLLFYGGYHSSGALVWPLTMSLLAVTFLAGVVPKPGNRAVARLQKNNAMPFGYQFLYRWSWMRWAIWKIAPYYFWRLVLAHSSSMGPFQEILEPVSQKLRTPPNDLNAETIHRFFLAELQDALTARLVTMSPSQKQALLKHSLALLQELNPLPPGRKPSQPSLRIMLEHDKQYLDVAPIMLAPVLQWLHMHSVPVYFDHQFYPKRFINQAV